MPENQPDGSGALNIAISYPYSSFLKNDYLEHALSEQGHQLFFVGAPAGGRAGYSQRAKISETLANLPVPPDLFLCIDPSDRYFPTGVEELDIPTVCWLGDIHLGTWRQEVAKFFDLLFLPHLDYLERYRKVVGHHQVEWLPLYVSPRVQPLVHAQRVYEVGFVGNIASAHRTTARSRRIELLRTTFRMNDLSHYYSHDELGQVYSRSKIVFNNTINGDLNLRLFEGTACGALVLTDSVANGLEQCFTVGQELVVYQDDADLIDKIRYYLAHEDERISIADAGRQRTLHSHTYAARAQTLMQRLGQPIERVAPMRTAAPTDRYHALRKIYTHMHALDPLLDEARSSRRNPLQRAADILPCLLRRLMV